MFSHFYHGNIRKYTVAFGTLFNNIYINRVDANGNDQRYRIPLAYGAKDTWVKRIEEQPVLVSDQGNSSLTYSYMPRMSFQITDIQYDPTRKRNSLNKLYEPKANVNSVSYSYAEVPYDITYELAIATRKIEDGLQILEQILPFFTPDFNITLDLNQFAKKIDIPIIYESYSQDIDYERTSGSDLEHRILTWTLGFRMKGYLYGPVKDSKIIKSAITQFFDYDNGGGTLGRYSAVFVGASGGTGVGTGATAYGYTVKIFGSDATNFDIFGVT